MTETKKVITPQYTYNEMAIKLEEDIATPSSAKRFFDDLPESKEDVSPSKKGKKNASPVKGTPKKGRALPASLAEASDEDRMMFAMRKQNQPWNVIQDKWNKITGDDIAAAVLRARYSRLKAAFQSFSEQDVRASIAKAPRF